MLRVLMPRFYVLLAVLTTGALVLTFTERSRDNTGAAVGWFVGFIVGVFMLVAPLVVLGLMRRVRPVSRRGRHAQR